MRFEQVSEDSGFLTAPGLKAGYARQAGRGVVWYVRRGNDEVARGTVATVGAAQEKIIHNLQGARPAKRKPRKIVKKVS